ncbi:hypothetical protein NNO07_28360, partial [Pseudomonas resinovorans]|nr:hypothetical protein [Pseudomonas resinovorans]
MQTGQECRNSRLFFDPKAARMTNLSKVRLLGCRVDTVRQLYRGMVRPEVLALFEESGLVSFAGHQWHAG